MRSMMEGALHRAVPLHRASRGPPPLQMQGRIFRSSRSGECVSAEVRRALLGAAMAILDHANDHWGGRTTE
jgi:hypothetical protein